MRKARCARTWGAGINYTTFFNEDFNDTGKAAGLSDLSLKDSWGAAGQVGLDYLINRDWLLNMSVWYMDIDTDVKFKAGGVDQKVSTRLDPWVFMFSAGYRF
ncbi:outer membrane protein W [Klebsiella pneumoniae subsp. pneumoniae]|nr:outer membrane protein W [Klebsiella pneumoniae subsp. pneumoniae]